MIFKFLTLFSTLIIYHRDIVMACKVETLSDLILELGEGPHWDSEMQSLYFVGILGGSIHRYDYNEDKVYSCKVENEPLVSFIIPVDGTNNEFALGIGRRVGIVKWDGYMNTTKIIRTVFEVEKEPELSTNRFNDAKADPRGRLFGGTMKIEGPDMFQVRNGNFYSYTPEKGVIKWKTSIGISNGLAWNEKTNKMYYIDSLDLNIIEYDYDPKSGNISSPKVLVDFRVDEQNPNFVADGMTIDNNGFLFVATWGGSKILKINTRNGKIEQEIQLPAEQITSCAFGGPNLDILYVTSAARGGKSEPAGRTFKITGLGAVGLKMSKVKL